MYLTNHQTGLLVASIAIWSLSTAVVAQNIDVRKLPGIQPIPTYTPLPSRVIGVIVLHPQPVLAFQRIFGPKDLACFSSGESSYRCFYVPVKGGDGGETRSFRPMDPRGEKVSIDGLSLASARTLEPWGITEPYTLVEVMVNQGEGCGPDECLATTGLEVLGPARDYKIRASEIVSDCETRYRRLLGELLAEIRDKAEPGFEPPRQGAGSSIKSPPPEPIQGRRDGRADQDRGLLERSLREEWTKAKAAIEPQLKGAAGVEHRDDEQTFPYVTWLSEERRLRVCFLTTLRCGKYLYGRGTEPKRDPGPMSGPNLLGVSPERRRGNTGSCTRSRRDGSMSSHRTAPRSRAGRSNPPASRSDSNRRAQWRRRSQARPAV